MVIWEVIPMGQEFQPNDVSTGQIIESATFTASDHYTIISEEEVMPSANTEAVEETENGNSVSSPQAKRKYDCRYCSSYYKGSC